MSSLVSIRSYQRRKSAQARLETSSMTPSSSEQQGEAGRSEPVGKIKQRRVKSALESKREQEASNIFPELNATDKAEPEWGVSKYTEDFGPKTAPTPVPVRPVSPTRRHNPHPSKAFIHWKHPVRIHDHKKAVPPPPDSWRYINEGFYEDYTDNYNTGDAKTDIPITNVATIEFPGKNTKKKQNSSASMPKLVPGVSVMKAQLNPRSSQRNKHTTSQTLPRPASPKTLMIHGTIKGSTLPVFKDWLKHASEKERLVVLQMLHAAHDNSESSRMQKAVNEVLQSDSAGRVQDWLKTANRSERQIVLHVLENLAVATEENDVHHSDPYVHYRYKAGRHRTRTYPIMLRRRAKGHEEYSLSSRTITKHLEGNHSSSSQGKPSLVEIQGSSSVSSGVFGAGLVGKKLTTKSRDQNVVAKEKSSEEFPEIWHHRIKKKQAGSAKVRPVPIFNLPNKDPGQHFSLHPEWPIA